MRKLVLFLLFCFCALLAGKAQTKMNFDLGNKVLSAEDKHQKIDVFIQGDIRVIEDIVKAGGGQFKYAAGNIASVEVSIEQISYLISSKSVWRIEAYPPSVRPLNDSVLKNTNVLPVHAGQAPLPQAYDGKGIVIGYIDTGIDFTHPDFKDNLGHTRIKYIWDHKGTPAAAPSGYSYGIEWDSTKIDNGLCTENDKTYNGHGTHVVGKASGNGLATGQYLGIAPKSDIIMVALDFSNAAKATSLSDAVQYIYAKAFAMGKPCVINGSLGTDFGSHDGLDLESQLINNLINQRPGQAFVAAAGNSGNIPFHLGYTVTADTNFTLFTPSGGFIYMDIWADTNDLKNVNYAIGADQMVPVHSYRGRTKFTNMATPFNVLMKDTVYNKNGKRIGIIQRFVDSSAGRYNVQILIKPDTAAYNWRLVTKGTGKFDLWDFNLSKTSVAIVNSGLPTVATMPDLMYYKFPDLNKTVASGFQCLDNVITVANYINRRSYTEYNGTPFLDVTIPVGQRALTSAIGPTRDGRFKPDISAPGDYTIAAIESNYKAGLIGSGNTVTMAQGGFHVRNGFTSHAAPGVAAIAALYLQKNSTATAIQVKNAIIRCPIQDVYTGSCLPDNYWGYGKVNAFGALLEILTTTQPTDRNICVGNNTVFSTTASGTGLTYQWVTQVGNNCINLTNVAPYSGVTTDTLTITNATMALSGSKYRCVVSNAYSCDVTSDSAVLTVNALPAITASASALTVCAGAMLTLKGSGGISYLWTGGANNNVAFAAPALPTSYTVTGTDANNCSNMATIGITVNPLPTVTANATATTVCEGTAVTLTGGGANSYTWSGGVGNGVGFIPVVANQTYTVTGTDLNNCSNTATVKIVMNALPLVSANATANTVCTGSSVKLMGSGALSYAWTGGVTDGVAFKPIAALANYTVTGTDVNNCVGTATTSISVVPLPVVVLSGLATYYCFDAGAQTLIGSPVGGTYSGTGITNAITGTFNPVNAGTGSKIITYNYVDANNCIGFASKSTTVLSQLVSADSCPTIIASHIDENIANIFTPNNDGINDEFKVNYIGTPASDFNLSIFDRWGVSVFTSTNPNVKWDGRTTAGLKVSTGTYFYILVNAGVRYKGYVALFE